MDFETSMSFIDFLRSWLQNTSVFDLIIKGVFVYIVLFWFALIIWSARDVIHRSNNVLFQTFAILLNTFIPVFGLIIYLLLRPSQTLIEKYYEELEYKALNADQFCEKCSHPVSENFDFCPECGNNLKNSCNHCKRPSFATYLICPFCGVKKHEKAQNSSKLKVESLKPEVESTKSDSAQRDKNSKSKGQKEKSKT